MALGATEARLRAAEAERMELAGKLAAVEATIQTLQTSLQGHSLTVQQVAGL